MTRPTLSTIADYQDRFARERTDKLSTEWEGTGPVFFTWGKDVIGIAFVLALAFAGVPIVRVAFWLAQAWGK